MLFLELQPVDTYQLHLPHPFSSHDRQLLSLLYQPLVGSEAMSLFMTLWADAEQDETTEFNHYHLMNVLTMPLGKIFEARISLEAIGLLRTYRQQAEQRRFLYELLPPLDAASFFADPLLSTFLYSKIGEQAYRRIRNRFIERKVDLSNYQEISRTFLDVFQPLHFTKQPSEMTSEMLETRGKSKGIPFVQSDFDFQLMEAGLTEQMVPKRALASVSKELISKLAFLYSLTPLDMQKIIMMALDENLELPEERLRKAALDYYKMNISQQPPALQKAFSKKTEKTNEAVQPKTREERLIAYLENTSPREMLRDFHGREPFSVDVQLAERLLHTHGLSVGVVNVLLQYVILRNDGKITNAFAERIASHWSSKKITTAKEAMEISRIEHDRYMKWLHEGKKRSQPKRQPTREEKVPDWFYKRDEEEAKEIESSVEADQLEAKRRQLQEKLKAMTSGVK